MANEAKPIEVPEVSSPAPAEVLPVEGRDDVYLRLMRVEDAEEFYEVLKPGGENLDKYQWWDSGFTLEAFKTQVADTVKKIAEGKELRYMIVNKEDESIIGDVNVYNYDSEADTAEVGYLITPDFEGKHIVSSSTRTLVGYATQFWGLKKIVADIEVGNERSERLAEKNGAKPTGEVKRVQGGDKERNMRRWEIDL
jgi:RimJ/RimL family protein N-acetyltransferase